MADENFDPLELMTTSSSSTTNDNMQDPIMNEGKKRKFVNRKKLELDFLREKVCTLQTHLSVLQNVKKMEYENGSEWEQLAREQAKLRHDACAENAELKATLEEQLEIAEALQVLIAKKPRVQVCQYDD